MRRPPDSSITIVFSCSPTTPLPQGWPIIVHVKEISVGTAGGFNMAGTNSSGQVPRLDSNNGMIDDDTPQSARTKTSTKGDDMTLIFSDEFNVDGRTFYEGEDRQCCVFFLKHILSLVNSHAFTLVSSAYWEAMDLYCKPTDSSSLGSERTAPDRPYNRRRYGRFGNV